MRDTVARLAREERTASPSASGPVRQEPLIMESRRLRSRAMLDLVLGSGLHSIQETRPR